MLTTSPVLEGPGLLFVCSVRAGGGHVVLARDVVDPCAFIASWGVLEAETYSPQPPMCLHTAAPALLPSCQLPLFSPGANPVPTPVPV